MPLERSVTHIFLTMRSRFLILLFADANPNAGQANSQEAGVSEFL